MNEHSSNTVYFISFECSAGIDNNKNEIIYNKLLNIYDVKEIHDSGTRIVGIK